MEKCYRHQALTQSPPTPPLPAHEELRIPLLAEHWDVIEDEATREKSVSGLPMFGVAFPS